MGQCRAAGVPCHGCQVDKNEKIIMIDFPQMVSVSHRNAKM